MCCCVHTVPTVDAAQVIPDWRGPRTNGDGALHDEALDALHERTAKACNPSLISEEEKKRKSVSTLKQEYVANKHTILALENSMKNSLPNGCLAEFVIEDPPRSLLPGEKRYRVPMGDWDEFVLALSPDREFRIAIARRDGSVEYECDSPPPHTERCSFWTPTGVHQAGQVSTSCSHRRSIAVVTLSQIKCTGQTTAFTWPFRSRNVERWRLKASSCSTVSKARSG